MSGDDGLRAALVEAQVGHWRRDDGFRCSCGADIITGFLGHLADALLPVVTAWAEQRVRERAAEELHMAAVAFREMASPTLTNDPFIRASDWAARILDTRLSERYPDVPAADDGTGQP